MFICVILNGWKSKNFYPQTEWRYVCRFCIMSICPLAYLNSCMFELNQISVFVACDRASVILWRLCSMLGTSGSMTTLYFHLTGHIPRSRFESGSQPQISNVFATWRHAVWLCHRIQRQLIAHRGEACYLRSPRLLTCSLTTQCNVSASSSSDKVVSFSSSHLDFNSSILRAPGITW